MFDKNYVFASAKEILMCDSPTGFTSSAMNIVKRLSEELGFKFETSVKGTGIITVEGQDSTKTIGICSHLDTLGLMVRSVKPCGTLAVTNIGGPLLPTLDGEYCKIYTRCGKIFTGTILSTSPAVHVFKDADEKKRNLDNLEVRIDEVVKSGEDVSALGIQPGDFICFDPKTTITENGFIKSRFLDDKLSVACCLGVLKAFADKKNKPKCDVKFLFSVYEECGHGMGWIPSEITELLAVDMGCIGDDLQGNEFAVSICCKDSSGPYDYDYTSRLIKLAKDNKVNYVTDIFPMYGSDVSAALRAGNDVIGALIGPGVHASHGMERSHYDAAEATMKLIMAYMLD